MTKTLLCLGFGYTARALAPQLLQAGWKVIGTTRSADDAVPVHGVELITWPGAPLSLDGVTHILSSVGPTAEGDPVLNDLADALAEAAQGDTLEWVGYLSTTAVYGDHDGAWVDEDTAVTPSSQRGRWRAAAETGWQAIPDLFHREPCHLTPGPYTYRSQSHRSAMGAKDHSDLLRRSFTRCHVKSFWVE